MKIITLVLLLFLTGCSKENIVNEVKGVENTLKAENYVDDNPIKIGLYKNINGVYKIQKEFISSMKSLKDIGVFSIILSNQEEERGRIKNLYASYSSNYENFSHYKIGYELIINLNDGTSIKETVLKPKYFTNYTFSDYLYIWLYDDINNSGWYSHIEENEYNDSTVMTSIKLMATEKGNQEIKNVLVTAFTYDEDDFDSKNNYRGVSKYTLNIKKED